MTIGHSQHISSSLPKSVYIAKSQDRDESKSFAQRDFSGLGAQHIRPMILYTLLSGGQCVHGWNGNEPPSMMRNGDGAWRGGGYISSHVLH